MKPVDYDAIAPSFDRRYERNPYEGVRRAIRDHLGGPPYADVLEVGCGTGHWLAAVADIARAVVGLDPSPGMLDAARRNAPEALLVRGGGEHLPWRDESFDRVFCVNALHHMHHQAGFIREARRTLRMGGALLTIGLDPHPKVDQWWVYDYFPSALTADLSRYPAAESIRDWLLDAGFSDVRTTVAQHFKAAVPFAAAVERGTVERHATSQLMVITDAEWEAGRARLEEERPVLRYDLRLFGTTARLHIPRVHPPEHP